jgi:addiction module antitoxin, RelB/DinJ family
MTLTKNEKRDTDIRVRVNSDLKQSTQNILKELGLSMSDAVNLFLIQVEQQRGLPFPVQLPPHTQKAFEDARDGRLIRYSSIEEMNQDLGIGECEK